MCVRQRIQSPFGRSLSYIKNTALARVSASDVLSVKLPVPKDLQKQQEIGNEVKKRRSEAKQLRHEAEAVVTSAKARVERIILGEETVE